MFRKLGLALIALLGILLSGCGDAGERGLLWRVIQACVANHSLTGAAFPCLAVHNPGGPQAGYAVLRSPLDKTHIIVSPTVRTIGIEAETLRAPGAPDYFADAWASRHYVADALGHDLGRADLALAVNSRPGRSQDQLHIHVDCVRPALRDALARLEPGLQAGRWSRVSVLAGAPRYYVTLAASTDLADLNPFAFVAGGMHIAPDRMDDWTIVLAGAADIGGRPGFFVLAREVIPNGHDIAHGEALLDHDCRGYR